jgi:hypothetical protein
MNKERDQWSIVTVNYENRATNVDGTFQSLIRNLDR